MANLMVAGLQLGFVVFNKAAIPTICRQDIDVPERILKGTCL